MNYLKQGSKVAIAAPARCVTPDEMAYAIQWLKEHGFACVTLGPRILRAETAAIYACAIVAERGLQ